jgi:hypothetical protein
MHPENEKFLDANNMIAWLNDHDIKYLPRQLDHDQFDTEFNYESPQVVWFDNLYQSKSYNSNQNLMEKLSVNSTDTVNLTRTGRACCGGRTVCKDKNYRSREFFVKNEFPDWYCSVNHFFVFVKQVTGEIFVNKDCKMNYEQTVGPIGNLTESKKLLDDTRNQLVHNTLPIIKCKKERCFCGLCAPKAKNLEDFKNIMEKYQRL